MKDGYNMNKSPQKNTKNGDLTVGYCRVSTDDQADNGLSLDYQEQQCIDAAHRDKKRIYIIRDEGKSGTNLQRKGIQEVIDLAKKREICTVYVTHSDRLARNIVDHAFLRNALKLNGVELKYLNGQSSSYDASSTMADNMFATINQYHSDNTREKTRQATDAKAKAGYFPTHAPIGYLNRSNPDKSCEKVAKKIIIPNPDSASLVTEAFKLYATGQYNTDELNDLMFEKGLTTNRGKKIASSVFNVILKNRLYLGEIHWGDIHVKNGKHEPLIDEDTFNQVQSKMFAKVGGRCRRRKYFWLLTGYTFCAIHKRRYAAEFHLNKSKSYYHCPNRDGCGKYVERTELEEQVANKFKDLKFTPEFTNSIIEKVKTIFEERRNSFCSKQKSLINRRNACEAKLKAVEDRLLDGTLARSDYTRIKGEITVAVDGINVQLDKLVKTREVNIDVASEIINFTKNIYNVYMQAPEQLQKKFIGFFFDAFYIENKVIIKTCYSPLFEELMRLKVVNYKTPNTEKSLDTKADSEVIIRPKLGS